MSLRTISLRLLTIRPRISFDRDCLRVADSRWVRAIRLGLAARQTEFHFDRGVMEHRVRRLWFRPREWLVPFSELSHIEYGYRSVGTSWGWGAGGIGRQDELDVFTVSVVAKSGRAYPVCAFYGEGAVETGWIGTLLGDDALADLSGSQEAESRQFVRALSRGLGIPIGRPITELGEMATCPACGHPTSHRQPKCLYCGAATPPAAKPPSAPPSP